jgi:hypothetical protein
MLLRVEQNSTREHAAKIKAWPSRLRVRHEANNRTLEKVIILRSPKIEAGIIIGNDVTNEKRTDIWL